MESRAAAQGSTWSVRRARSRAAASPGWPCRARSRAARAAAVMRAGASAAGSGAARWVVIVLGIRVTVRAARAARTPKRRSPTGGASSWRTAGRASGSSRERRTQKPVTRESWTTRPGASVRLPTVRVRVCSGRCQAGSACSAPRGSFSPGAGSRVQVPATRSAPVSRAAARRLRPASFWRRSPGPRKVTQVPRAWSAPVSRGSAPRAAVTCRTRPGWRAARSAQARVVALSRPGSTRTASLCRRVCSRTEAAEARSASGPASAGTTTLRSGASAGCGSVVMRAPR